MHGRLAHDTREHVAVVGCGHLPQQLASVRVRALARTREQAEATRVEARALLDEVASVVRRVPAAETQALHGEAVAVEH